MCSQLMTHPTSTLWNLCHITSTWCFACRVLVLFQYCQYFCGLFWTCIMYCSNDSMLSSDRSCGKFFLSVCLVGLEFLVLGSCLFKWCQWLLVHVFLGWLYERTCCGTSFKAPWYLHPGGFSRGTQHNAAVCEPWARWSRLCPVKINFACVGCPMLNINVRQENHHARPHWNLQF